MLKSTATWQEIQAEWDALTYEQQVTVTKKFDADLRQHNPTTHTRLLTMFENEEK